MEKGKSLKYSPRSWQSLCCKAAPGEHFHKKIKPRSSYLNPNLQMGAYILTADCLSMKFTLDCQCFLRVSQLHNTSNSPTSACNINVQARESLPKAECLNKRQSRCVNTWHICSLRPDGSSWRCCCFHCIFLYLPLKPACQLEPAQRITVFYL